MKFLLDVSDMRKSVLFLVSETDAEECYERAVNKFIKHSGDGEDQGRGMQNASKVHFTLMLVLDHYEINWCHLALICFKY